MNVGDNYYNNELGTAHIHTDLALCHIEMRGCIYKLIFIIPLFQIIIFHTLSEYSDIEITLQNCIQFFKRPGRL